MAGKATKPFKEWMDAAAVGRIADMLAAARPGWDAPAFVAAATDGLTELELKDRIRHVAAALRRHLAEAWPEAVAHMLDALPPPLPPDGETLADSFDVWPFCQVVEEHGVDDFDTSVPALAEMTRRWTSEGAVRPFIERYPERMFAILTRWAASDDAHLRRLASEGTRTRLPWAGRLRDLQADPAPVFALLEPLKDDPSLYVRRSVANNLNDLSKDHAALVTATAQRWMQGASRERAWLVRHALRSLLKAGDPAALAILGFTPPQLELKALEVTPSTVPLGGAVTLRADLRSLAEQGQPLLIDYAEHRPLKSGKRGRRVFKGSKRTLPPAPAATEVRLQHSLKPVTTRKHLPGTYTLELLINGKSLGTVDFELTTP